MTNSRILRAAVAYTDLTLPKLTLDPCIDANTQFLYDFENTFCNQNAAGALTSGALFTDLNDEKTTATYIHSDSAYGGTISQDGSGLVFPVSGGSAYTRRVNLGAGYNEATSYTTDDLLLLGWIKIPTTGFDNYTSFFTSNWLNVSYGTASNPYLSVVVAGAANTIDNIPFDLDTPFQFAVHWSPGRCRSYKNGALIEDRTTDSSGVALTTVTPANTSEEWIVLANYGAISHYRYLMSKPENSDYEVSDLVAFDYKQNVGRFS